MNIGARMRTGAPFENARMTPAQCALGVERREIDRRLDAAAAIDTPDLRLRLGQHELRARSFLDQERLLDAAEQLVEPLRRHAQELLLARLLLAAGLAALEEAMKLLPAFADAQSGNLTGDWISTPAGFSNMSTLSIVQIQLIGGPGPMMGCLGTGTLSIFGS